MKAWQWTATLTVCAGAIVLCLAVAAAVAYSASFERPLLIGAIALACGLPVVFRVQQGKFDPFEPIVIICLGIAALFVVRPTAQLLYNEPTYLGWDVRPGFDRALCIVLLGTVATFAGYAATGRSIAARLPVPETTWSITAATRFAFVILLFAVVLVLALVHSVGAGPAASLLGGRTTLQDAVLRETTSYYYLAPVLMVPVALLLYETARMHSSRSLFIASLLVAAVFVAIMGPRGDRLWLLTLLGPLAVLPYLRRGTRPSSGTILLVFAVVFLVGIAFLGSYRTFEERNGTAKQIFESTVSHPGQATKNFLLTEDTEMFPVLSLLVQTVPQHTGYQPGVTVESLVAQPIPSTIYPNKPLSADSLIYRQLLPERAAQSRAGPAPSMFGGFYFDSGIPGVIIGCVLVGVAARTIFEYWRRNPQNAGVRLLFASCLPLVLVMIRGNPSDTFARATYTVIPLVAFFVVNHLLGERRGMRHVVPVRSTVRGAR
jgi:hypothetical protein